MPSISDVARLASVSTATVSRALSNPEVVAEETRARIQAAIEALGYELNSQARALRTLKALKILVTVPDISNPFFANIIRGAEEAARREGYAIILGDTRHDPEVENQYALMLQRKEVDGLIFLGHRVPDVLETMIARKSWHAPIVNGCEYTPELPVSSVHIDNAGAAAEGIAYLVSLGHRRIGVITGLSESPITHNRLGGVREAAVRLGVADSLTVANGDYTVSSGFDATRALIADAGVTAVFSFSDEMAIGAMNAVYKAGLTCPDDISVLGFDDIRFAGFLRPSLSTIRQPTTQIGEQAVAILMRILRGDQKALTRMTLPHELQIRESTAAGPYGVSR